MTPPAVAIRPGVIPFALKDAPALIERLLPVQKLSAEAYKEQMAGGAKTLVPLGSYWKGRKPLILAKACILGCLLPATKDPKRDLEIFEMLMGMDACSFAARAKRKPTPKKIVAHLPLAKIEDYFQVAPLGALPKPAPVDWSNPEYKGAKVAWRPDLPLRARRILESQMLPSGSYRERVAESRRPEEVSDVHEHIWEDVNAHLGTNARSIPELVEQLGVMRFGHRPKVADTFCGSGQIPFEAARLGCDVHASDLNPVACMLTWGALHVIGGSLTEREKLEDCRQALAKNVQSEVDQLGVEVDGNGWRAKVFLYCVEVQCPQTGWRVPLLPSRVVSKKRRVIAELVPDPDNRRYDIRILSGVSDTELKKAETGTVWREGRFGEASLIHEIGGKRYKTKIAALFGSLQSANESRANHVRLWEKGDVVARRNDLLQERLYCVQWMRKKLGSRHFEYEFRSATTADINRERIVESYVNEHLAEWQDNGWVPDMRIEEGGPPRYQGRALVRSRGWTHWHHVFNPRQLLLGALLNRHADAHLKFGSGQALNRNCRLSRWDPGFEKIADAFYNQALNPLFNYGCRGSRYALGTTQLKYKRVDFVGDQHITLACAPAATINVPSDLFITDPPYGDAVRYEEILDFFVAWLRGNPPPEFADWIWDGRRALAIRGDDENFRRGMVAAYKRMTECLPDNGMQVIMFTHQSGEIWADMANIVWASGLQVTAAWYVVTETDSPLRDGSYVKGTVLLICRKREGTHKTTRDDLAWEIQDEVEEQIQSLTGLNQEVRNDARDENVFDDADLQMAGYAAALRTLTRYARIDGRDMTSEATRPRIKGQTTFVDELIAFAVNTANQCLVPQDIDKSLWDKLCGAERFYLKMLELEARGTKTLDNYQNFAKAFKVRDFHALLGDSRANRARLKDSIEFGRGGMSEGSELYGSVLRAVLYAVMELLADVDTTEVLAHLTHNVPDYYGDLTQRERAIAIAGYLAKQLEGLRSEEASAARVFAEALRNQRVG